MLTTKTMNDILEQIALCVENGKINQKSPYPPSMKGQLGADELTFTGFGRGCCTCGCPLKRADCRYGTYRSEIP